MMTHAQIERRNALVLEHMSIVEKIAGSVARRVPPTIQLDDLKQAGAIGLMEAAARYDATQGVPFVAWAIIRVRGAILDHVGATYKHLKAQHLPPSEQLQDGVFEEKNHFASDHGAGAAAIEATCETSRQVHRIHLVVRRELPRRERRVVEMYYAKGHTMEIIARKLHVSPTRVSQMHSAAIGTVREKLAA